MTRLAVSLAGPGASRIGGISSTRASPATLVPQLRAVGADPLSPARMLDCTSDTPRTVCSTDPNISFATPKGGMSKTAFVQPRKPCQSAAVSTPSTKQTNKPLIFERGERVEAQWWARLAAASIASATAARAGTPAAAAKQVSVS